MNALTSRRIVHSLKAKADMRRTFAERAADWMTRIFGTVTFLVTNALWFLSWILFNLYPPFGLQAFDPFPFIFLTTSVSLEAILLSIIVLISQNRASRIGDLREEIDLQMDVITEEEVTKLLEMMGRLMEKNGISVANDKVFQSMVVPTNLEKIERSLEREVDER